MARLIVRNIGPIKEVEIDLCKVNVFMGPQGCGKSTLAKLISFCSWMEKVNDSTRVAASKGLAQTITSFHRMEGYFREDSQLAYLGDNVCLFIQYPEPLPDFGDMNDYNVERSHESEGELLFHKVEKSVNPKVAYIPAERNFVSVVPNLLKYAEKDDSLQSFVNDWFEAKRVYTQQHPLHIESLGIDFYYNAKSDTDVVLLPDSPIRLNQSSSGFQSVIPLMALLNYFSSTIYEENKPFSPIENQQMRDILAHVSSGLSTEMEQQVIERIRGFLQGKVYTHTQFIIEEPEQNLFPETQCALLYHLLGVLNHGKNHRAVITTHSPYILYALNNCLLANVVRENMPSDELQKLACSAVKLNPKDVAVWEISEGKLIDTGSVTQTIQDKDGLIRKNYFNDIMGHVMRDFNTMLAYKD